MAQKPSNRITSHPQIFGGQPIIRGMRIRVADVLGYLAAGETRESILKEFPDLQDQDITAALEFTQKSALHRVIAAE